MDTVDRKTLCAEPIDPELPETRLRLLVELGHRDANVEDLVAPVGHHCLAFLQALQFIWRDDVHLLLALATCHRGARALVRLRQVSQHAHARRLGSRAGQAAQHADLLANQFGGFFGRALRADLENQLRPGVPNDHLVELVADGLEVRNGLNGRHKEHMG